MKNSQFPGRVAAAVALVFGVACTTLRAPLPASLENAPAWQLKKHRGGEGGQQLRFGNFAITDVRRGWRHSRSRGARLNLRLSSNEAGSVWVDYTEARSRQKLSFAFRPAGSPAPWLVQSVDSTWQQDPDEHGTYQTLRAVYRSTLQEPTQLPWLLQLRTDFSPQGRRVAGQLTRGADTVVHVQPLFEYAAVPGAWVQLRSATPTGYVFLNSAGHVLGAVEVLGCGTVWLAPAAPPELHPPLAATAAALLLMPGYDW
ncbi:hypothetical protein [Hymenobacter weizhouensis]|uniref:hypothetical protein n=1 Tax=Hymenobacter sp. YIM 151500-1 TaxID=2987689 RepID=UPI0022260E08|nr:hypothetical protein [Hymenobacter sp. YIM 151500-1]UYZ62424.1 hypothetical protein OIS53_15660 [Hymenobacter sp. YIM 151500-1]